MGKNGGQAIHSVVQTTGQKECNPRKQKASDFFHQEWCSTFVFLLRNISYGVSPEWRMVAFTFLSLRSALLENLVQNWHILKWFPYYHLYSGESTNFQKFSTWYEIWVLGGTILCSPLRWDGIPNFEWNRVNYLQQQPVAFRRSCCCQVPAKRESINPDENYFFQCIGPSITKPGDKY